MFKFDLTEEQLNELCLKKWLAVPHVAEIIKDRSYEDQCKIVRSLEDNRVSIVSSPNFPDSLREHIKTHFSEEKR